MTPFIKSARPCWTAHLGSELDPLRRKRLPCRKLCRRCACARTCSGRFRRWLQLLCLLPVWRRQAGGAPGAAGWPGNLDFVSRASWCTQNSTALVFAAITLVAHQAALRRKRHPGVVAFGVPLKAQTWRDNQMSTPWALFRERWQLRTSAGLALTL